VPVVHDQQQAQTVIDDILGDKWHRRRIGHQGYRKVMTEHTFSNRTRDMFDAVEIGGYLVEEAFPKVTLAIPTNRPENLRYIRENFERQTYPNLELILVLNNDRYEKEEVSAQFAQHPNVKVFQLPEERTLGECLNLSIEQSTGQYWAKLDDDNIYLEDFITDLMLPFKYCNTGIVGKGTYFIYLEGLNVLALRFPSHEHSWVDFMSGSAMVVKMDIFEKIRFPETSVGEDTQFMKDYLKLGHKMYSTDVFNYIVMRKANLDQHTWKINELDLLKSSEKICDGLDIDFVRA
jgi:glycosyltransferase involved in cell wall biosynthesis